MRLWRDFLWRHGFKRYLLRCPTGRHDWRKLYGDERQAVGHLYLCQECPRTRE
jgi:hypothetical protein